MAQSSRGTLLLLRVEQNVPRTFVEQSESVNTLIHIVEHPWNIRGTLLNEKGAHSVEQLPWNTDFRPILTLILTEISAWNIMFHGCLFDDNYLILCVIVG